MTATNTFSDLDVMTIRCLIWSVRNPEEAAEDQQSLADVLSDAEELADRIRGLVPEAWLQTGPLPPDDEDIPL